MDPLNAKVSQKTEGGDEEKKEFKLLEAGLYEARVKTIVYKDSLPWKKKDGTEQTGLEFQFELLDLGGQEFDWDHLKGYVNYTPGDIPLKSNLYKWLMALNSGKDIPSDVKIASFVGKYCEVDVSHNPGKNGKTYMNIKTIKTMRESKIQKYLETKTEPVKTETQSKPEPENKATEEKKAKEEPKKTVETADVDFEF